MSQKQINYIYILLLYFALPVCRITFFFVDRTINRRNPKLFNSLLFALTFAHLAFLLLLRRVDISDFPQTQSANFFFLFSFLHWLDYSQHRFYLVHDIARLTIHSTYLTYNILTNTVTTRGKEKIDEEWIINYSLNLYYMRDIKDRPKACGTL